MEPPYRYNAPPSPLIPIINSPSSPMAVSSKPTEPASQVSSVALQRIKPSSSKSASPSSSPSSLQLFSNTDERSDALQEYFRLKQQISAALIELYSYFDIPHGLAHFFHFSIDDFFRIFFDASFSYLVMYPQSQILMNWQEHEKLLSHYVSLITADLKSDEVQHELYHLIHLTYKMRVANLTSPQQDEVIFELSTHAQFLTRLIRFLNLSTVFSLPLAGPNEEPAKLPYTVLLSAFAQVNATLNHSLMHMNGLKEAIEKAKYQCKQRGVDIAPHKKKISSEINELLSTFKRAVRLHSLKLKAAAKQFSSFLEEDEGIAPLKKLKYFSFTSSMIINPLGKGNENLLERLQELYYALNERSGVGQNANPLSLIDALYEGFIAKVRQLSFTDAEQSQQTTIKPLLPFLTFAADFIQNDWFFNKAKQKKVAQFKKNFGSGWHALLQLFLAHLTALKDEKIGSKEGLAKREALDHFSANCKTTLNALRKLQPKEWELLFGKERLLPFTAMLTLQLQPGLAKAAKMIEGKAQAKVIELKQNPVEEGMSLFKCCQHGIALSQFTYSKILQEINQKLQFQNSQQEISQLKAEYFFQMENRELAKRSKKMKTAAKAVALPSLSPPRVPELESEEAHLVPKLENLSLSSESKAIRRAEREVEKEVSVSGLKVKKGLQQLLNQSLPLKPLSSAQDRDVFYQDAIFHFNHFLRSQELLQLVKEGNPSFLSQAIIPHLVYHLGLANEQALSPLYLEQHPEENVSHNTVQMAAMCHLAPKQVEPLNEASIAFRYPYAQQRRLQCLGKEIPLGLSLILKPILKAPSLVDKKESLEIVETKKVIEEMVQGGICAFIASLSTAKPFSALKPWLVKAQGDVSQLFPPLELSSPFLEERKEGLKLACHHAELKLAPVAAALEALIEEKQGDAGLADLLQGICAHIKGFRQMLLLASHFPYQRFLSFFQAALLIRGQYALENSAQLIAYLEGEEWYTHSLRDYSEAYDIASSLSPDNQKRWALYDIRKSSDYPFWHRAQKREKSFKPIEKLCRAYQLSLAAVDDGEGFIPSKEPSDCIEHGYKSLKLFSEQLADLIEELLKKKVFSRIYSKIY